MKFINILFVLKNPNQKIRVYFPLKKFIYDISTFSVYKCSDTKYIITNLFYLNSNKIFM